MDVKITIIGAGVIGLAIAAELSKEFDDVFVIEKNEKFGQETSSRNSEVIHAGIYYETGSLKASLCVEGAKLLYEFCAAYGVPHKKIGKIIIAADEREGVLLQDIYEKARKNGASEISIIDGATTRKMEKSVNAFCALHSPNTGIIDSHFLMKTLYAQAEAARAQIVFNTEISGVGKNRAGGYALKIKGGTDEFFTRMVINCAGLHADKVAAMAGIETQAAGYKIHYCKGTYFSYLKKSPVNMLVYPLPQEHLAGLGIHATLDMAGRLRFGPDVEYVGEISYAIDERKRGDFFLGASKIIKGIEEESLSPDMCGIRPKIGRDGFRDFIIAHEGERDLPRFINLIGIESPGLTASLAIARYVKGMVSDVI